MISLSRNCRVRIFMKTEWHSFSDITRNPDNSITAEIYLNEESSWFSGHFPGDPILPGVAQILFVFDIIQSVNEGMSLKNVKRVKFRSLVRPGDSLRLNAVPHRDNNFAFKIHSGDEMVCSGMLQVE